MKYIVKINSFRKNSLAVSCFIGFFLFVLTGNSQNAIVTENALAGNPSSEWDINGAGDLSIQGFATDISVNKGQTVHFKIKTDASAYSIDVYRLGYYQGNGARKVGTGIITASLPQTQPADLYDASTGLTDCGNWAESAHWDVPAGAVSGIYIAKLIRTDDGGASHIVFIVRDDASTSDLFFQTADATWQAYNVYGGNSLYTGSTSYASGHAVKVSYNRPFITRNGGGGGGAEEDWLFNAEYPMLRWLERNGYDVTYTTNLDADRNGSLIQNHKVFLSVGHDEYWSGQQRANVEAARDAGVHLGFFSGNEIYWKTRWESSTDGSNTPFRTLVCYKEGDLGENICGGKCDPLPNVWTGLWRNGCDFPSADGCRPENALSGQISWDGTTGAIKVPDTYKNLRFWRNTSIATLGSGQTAILSDGTLGYEWDWEQYQASYPSGRIRLSETFQNSHTHHLSLYRHSSGAWVFGAGTVQWSWGLDGNHDRGGSAPDVRMQQATVNLFADMSVQPETIQGDLVSATAPSDLTAPVSAITFPADAALLPNGTQVTITGTATDNVLVAGVEVSVDGGATWLAASGTTNWSLAWTPTVQGTITITSRGFDDSGNMEIPSAGITATVSAPQPVVCPCTIFQPSDVPSIPLANDGQGIELGVKFQMSEGGYITGLRYYKGSGTTGIHIGHLWDNTGLLLAEAAYAGESASGWQEVTLATPIAVTAGTTYVASCFSSSGDYAFTDLFFTGAFTHGPFRALADGEDGANGVYIYGGEPAFPTDHYQSSNYWVDAVFSESVGPDLTPPTISATSPVNGATSINIGSSVSATFSEGIDISTLSVSTFELRDVSNLLVPAVISYNAGMRKATLDPSSSLGYSQTYTVTIKGGTGYDRIKDISGNALASDYTWSFTTAPVPPPPPTEGPGGPILLISKATNPFSRYPVEILRAEGFNEFTAMDISLVNSTVLNNYDVVIVGDIPLAPAEVTMLSTWANAGGTLIALKPDAQLATLLGLTPVGGTLADKYLLVNTASGPGTGIVGQTIQYHGAADLYTLNGATSIATLYSNASTATSNPAVTIKSVGSNGGQAIAFTYDLARSVVYTRQGNPDWAGQKRDGQSGPIRASDQFYPDWIDLNKVAIPQADEQQHLLSNIITSGNLHRKPLPRFWFLPKGLKAAVVMTGDDHGDAGMQPRFDINITESTAGCSVDDWECIRSTGYLYVGSTFNDVLAKQYSDMGFEVALHVNTNCANFTQSQYNSFITSQLSSFQSNFPSIPTPSTNRNHCIAWSDWSMTAETEASNGLRFDVNYYYWPDTWVQNRPGMFTGSGMPMRFAKADGSIIDCYQATTQMPDESGESFPAFCDALLDKANGPEGYYGVFTTNMHFDQDNHAGANAIVASAKAHNVPVVTAKQMLDWVDARNNSSFGSMTWSSNALSFIVTADPMARNMKAMIPMDVTGSRLAGVTFNGSPAAYTQQLIKGVEYAFVPALTGSYIATYSVTPTLVISAVAATPHADGTSTITWTTNAAADSRVDYGTTSGALTLNSYSVTPATDHTVTLTGLNAGTKYYYRVTSVDASSNSATEPLSPAAPLDFTMPSAPCAQDKTAADFLLGSTDANTLVSLNDDGEITLKPSVSEDFSGASVPAGWSDAVWTSGGATTYSGGQVSVNGSHVYTNSSFGPGTSVEFSATFTSGNFQNVGFTVDADFNSPWVVIGRGGAGDGNVYARNSDAQSVSLGSLVGAPHIYRIQWNTSTNDFQFYVDGSLIATPGITQTVSSNMILQISDYPEGGLDLSVDWVRITPYNSPGSFTSRIFDQTDTTDWKIATWTEIVPAGTSLSVFARGGNTSSPDGTWSAFQQLTNGISVGTTSRFLQYRTDLSTSDLYTTPVFKDISFVCSDTCVPPLAYISAVNASVCQGNMIQLQLDSAHGRSPYSLVVNGSAYNNVTVGQTFASFQPTMKSIWGSSGSPTNANGNDGQPIETGVKFQSSVNGFVTGVRFFKGVSNTGIHIGSLWTTSGTQLATATFTSETASGWQEVYFSTPVYILANATYIASYFSQDGTFAITSNYFSASGVTNVPLTALQAGVDGVNGVYKYGAGFPTGGNDANYWVDVLFMEDQSTPQASTYTLTSITDSKSCFNSGTSLSIASVTVTPLPTGTITASGSACQNQDMDLVFNANAGTGPFSVVVNGTTYNNVTSGVPFNSGVTYSSSAPVSLWDNSALPGTPSVADNAAIELGVKFRSSIAGRITGIRFYKGATNTGTHTGSLWSESGTLLATAIFSGETASGWQQVSFSSPVDIAANTLYVASYHTEVGYYSFDKDFFASSGLDIGSLHAYQNGENGPNGVYKYSSGGQFPTDTYSSSNYWVDVVFTTASPNNFTLSTVTDANGCSALTTGNTVTVLEPAPVSATITLQTDVPCKGLSNGSATVSVSGGIGAFEYLWNDVSAQTTATATGLTAGTYTVRARDMNGCNDTAYASVTISEPSAILTATVSHTDVQCHGVSNGQALVAATGGTSPYTYTWSNATTNDNISAVIAGNYSVTVADMHGCTVTQTVSIAEPIAIASAQSFTVCAGENVTVGASTYTSSGTYTDVLTAVNSCDSTVTTNLTVRPAVTTVQSFTVCAGDNVTVGASTYTASGTYTDVLTAANSCDSTVTTNLTVRPTNTFTQTITVCAGENVTVGASTYTSSGTYTDVLTDANSCDSTVTTNLIVRPAIASAQSFTVCAGDNVTVGASTYTSSGTYTDVLVAANSCDSTVTTNLTVRPANTFTQTITVCAGENIIVGASTYTSSGTYTDVLVAANSCDSTVTTNLTVRPAITTVQSFTVCAGEGLVIGTTTYMATGTYIVVLTASNSCDSTVTTHLTVLPANTFTQTITVCAGENVTVGASTYTSSGMYTDVLTAKNNCDSTVTTNLTVRPANTFTQTITICAGENVTVGASTYTSSGTYTDVLTAKNNCDSTVTTNLTVRPANTFTQTITICAGESVTVGASTYTSSGTYTDVLTAANSCDSTVTTNLTVIPSIVNNINISICQGDSILAGGAWQTSAGVFKDTLVAKSGCDSVVVTYLIVHPTYFINQLAAICQNDSILLGGSYQNTAGIYYDTLSSHNGCDSILATTLIVNTVDTSVTPNVLSLYANASGAQYQWLDCLADTVISGATAQLFVPSVSGSYAVIILQNNCSDTSSCYSITVPNGIGEASLNSYISIYPNPFADLLTIELGELNGDVHCSLTDLIGQEVMNHIFANMKTISLDLHYLPAGSYFLHIRIGERLSVIKVMKD